MQSIAHIPNHYRCIMLPTRSEARRQVPFKMCYTVFFSHTPCGHYAKAAPEGHHIVRLLILLSPPTHPGIPRMLETSRDLPISYLVEHFPALLNEWVSDALDASRKPIETKRTGDAYELLWRCDEAPRESKRPCQDGKTYACVIGCGEEGECLDCACIELRDDVREGQRRERLSY